MKICWNAIVKNEAARIDRCMLSLIDHVDCAVIYDTGSTDETPEKIEQFFHDYNKPCEVIRGEFVNFEQARNEALRLARSSSYDFNYLLLLDADMELKVERGIPDLNGSAYQVMQRAGSLAYYNTRVLAREAAAEYVGVTHEYLSVHRGIGLVLPEDFWCIDHFDGANRADKFERDIKLLTEAMKTDPNNERYNFYLAQSYRDLGNPHRAALYYGKRVSLGGWEEERWNAQVNYAHCLKDPKIEDEAGFVNELLEAHEMRPHRAEAMYDLAKHFREKGKNRIATIFAKVAAATPFPKDDVLFVNDYVYKVGAQEELSIAGFYDPTTREEAYRACDSVALGKHGYSGATQLARANLLHYVPHAHELMPSFWAKEIRGPQFPAGWALMNPSIARAGKAMHMIVRAVNYKITPDGRYDIDGKGSAISAENPIVTRNFILRINNGLQPETIHELSVPDFNDFPLVKGWEDMRLFSLPRGLCVSATVREANAAGRCEQWYGAINSEYKVMNSTPLLSVQEHEKNWMPIVGAGKVAQWVYQLGKVVDEHSRLIHKDCVVNAEHLRGGSQVIPFRSGFLCIVHEAGVKGDGQRWYWHRFAFLDVDYNVVKVSKPFVFHDKQIEFCAGLCVHPDGKRLVISYGVKDNSAWVATVDATEAAEFVFA